MAEPNEQDPRLASVREAFAVLSQGAPGVSPSAQDIVLVLEHHNRADADRGDRAERQAIREMEERNAVREVAERKECRKLWIGGVGVILVVAVVAALVRALPPEKQPEAVDKILVAFLGAIPGALAGYLFGKDDKDKKKEA